MKNLFVTLSILMSAFAVAMLSILPESRSQFPLGVIYGGASIANTLFHELGHTLFNWLFGSPAIPMIFTLFGADQAGGMTLSIDRSWIMQLLAFAGLGALCYHLRKRESILFIPSLLFSVAIICLAFTQYYLLVILYMGHGGSVAVGGWLLYRGCLYLDSRNQYERWLNAFLGFFLILSNFYFGYDLAFNADTREDYSAHAAFGIADNDLQAIADHMLRWSVRGIAIFTMGYCCTVMLGSMLLAFYRREKE